MIFHKKSKLFSCCIVLYFHIKPLLVTDSLSCKPRKRPSQHDGITDYGGGFVRSQVGARLKAALKLKYPNHGNLTA